jgi:type I restriction enzyme S subunit
VIAATIGNVNGQKFANTPLGLPPKGEQVSIVDFLDRKTARFDALIDKKRRLLELLEEKRPAWLSSGSRSERSPTSPSTPTSPS